MGFSFRLILVQGSSIAKGNGSQEAEGQSSLIFPITYFTFYAWIKHESGFIYATGFY